VRFGAISKTLSILDSMMSDSLLSTMTNDTHDKIRQKRARELNTLFKPEFEEQLNNLTHTLLATRSAT